MKNLTPIPHKYLEELHPTKNQNISGTPAAELSAGSGKQIWWQCKNNHENYRAPRDYIKANGCTQCQRENNLLSKKFPHLKAEWDTTKNTENFETISAGSNKKVWWICLKCKYIYDSAVYHRTRTKRPTGCPNCAGKALIQGINDLTTTHPDLIKQWHPTRNAKKPNQFRAGSHKKVWWICEKEHEWETAVRKRANLGQGCPVCSGNIVVKGFNDALTLHPHLEKEWHPDNTKAFSEYTAGSEYNAKWICDKNHEWNSNINNRTNKLSRCPTCISGLQASKAETAIYEYVVSIEPEAINNTRKIIKGELDIYIPHKNIAIEYNGVYWHSEASGKSKTYHYDKWKACKDKGIQLIQIWEDDWNRNPELIKGMLAHKLGVAIEPKVFARKTKIKFLTQTEANAFLNLNHIQGTAQGSIRLGLTIIDTERGVENVESVERLVAVMVLKKEPGTNGKTLNLLRFATSQPVVGGFTKLLKQAEQSGDIEKIITFSDNTVSDGGLYESTGFIAAETLAPDYMYLVSSTRIHKFNYRLKRFQQDPNLLWEPGLSERQLALLNNIPRIWDAGKTKWIKYLT